MCLKPLKFVVIRFFFFFFFFFFFVQYCTCIFWIFRLSKILNIYIKKKNKNMVSSLSLQMVIGQSFLYLLKSTFVNFQCWFFLKTKLIFILTESQHAVLCEWYLIFYCWWPDKQKKKKKNVCRWIILLFYRFYSCFFDVCILSW